MKEEIKKIPRKLIIFLLLILILVAIGVIGFMIINRENIVDAIIETFASFAFMFSEETGMAKALQIFLAIFGVMTLGWIISGFFNMVFDGTIGEYLKTTRFLSKLSKMKNHYIIAGGGRVGEQLAKELASQNKEYIIIEKDDKKILNLNKKGLLSMKGDVTDSDASDLIEAGIKNAKAIILAMPETEKNLLVTMAIKEINPDVEIYARADNQAFASRLKKAGAKVVINPEIAAAERFLKELD